MNSGLIFWRARIATWAFVILFGEPCCFAIISLIPETAKTFRTAPHAIIPVPGLAGWIKRADDLKFTVTSWGIVPRTIGKWTRCFFALCTAFSIAPCTSPAFHVQNHITPFPLPITTEARNLNWRPHAVTRVTRSTPRSSSANSFGSSSCRESRRRHPPRSSIPFFPRSHHCGALPAKEGSDEFDSFSGSSENSPSCPSREDWWRRFESWTVWAISVINNDLKYKSLGTCRICERLHSSMVEISSTIKNTLLHSGGEQLLCYFFPDFFRLLWFCTSRSFHIRCTTEGNPPHIIDRLHRDM